MSVNKNSVYQYERQKPRDRAKIMEEEYPDLHNVTYVDLSAVAPSPSRDYFRLQVTSTHVSLTEWQISHKPRATPLDHSVLLGNYAHEPNLVSEVARIFGKPTADYVMGLSLGKMDWLVRLPTKILARIMEYVGIKNLAILAPVCKRFNEICSGNTLWMAFYGTYVRSRVITEETRRHANYLGWKTTFFVNKLQNRVFPGKKVRLGVMKSVGDDEFLSAQAKLLRERRTTDIYQRGTVSSTGLYQYSSKPRAIPASFKPKIPEDFVSRVPSTLTKLKDGASSSSPEFKVKQHEDLLKEFAKKQSHKSKKGINFFML